MLRALDYEPDPDAAAHEINAFVADTTEDRIPSLIADGVLQPDTVLTLVNALYLKVSWETVFEPTAPTRPMPSPGSTAPRSAWR